MATLKKELTKKRQLEKDDNIEPALKKSKLNKTLNGKEQNGVTHDEENGDNEHEYNGNNNEDNDSEDDDIKNVKTKKNIKNQKENETKSKNKKANETNNKDDNETKTKKANKNANENESKNKNTNKGKNKTKSNKNEDNEDDDNDNENENDDDNEKNENKKSEAGIPWSTINVTEETRKAIDKLKFEYMMEIQAKAIPHVLEGKDLAGAAKTGSGKTLSFIIPAVELLAKLNWNKSMGTGVIVLAPTRELAIQIKGVAQSIAQFHRNLRVGMVIGGASRSSEAQMLKMGCSILIATPGRLTDHLENTTFRFDQLKMLVIDEADHILDIGFEHQMHSILQMIPKDRQTLLFSATLTDKTKDLVTMAFQRKPVFVRASGNEAGPTADHLEQMYAIVPQDKKLPALLTFLRQHRDEKILVFFSTKHATRFYERLFNSIGLRVLALYGAMSQDKRTNTFFEFVEAKKGILIATNVASRGLDFPAVHWCVQFDPPINPKEYIHRVGRTARAGLKGEAITFLQPSELAYLDLLKECGLDLKKLDIENVDYDSLQSSVESVVTNNYELKSLAEDGCRAFVRSYDERARTVFNNSGINRSQAARSFCLENYPEFRHSSYESGDGGRDRGYGGGRGRGGYGGGRGRGGRGGGGGFRSRF